MKIPLISRLLERRYSIADMDKAMDLLIAGKPSATGVNVTQTTALSCVPYLAGVRLIAETVGQLPLIEYKRVTRGKERATDRKVYQLLHDEPNPEMTAIAFKESLTGQALMWGNAFAEIQWDMETGIPVALWPLRSDRMQVGRDTITSDLIYAYRLPDGTTVKIPPYRVWHLAGFGFDGTIGYDPIYLAREAIGMSLAMEEFGARFFGNGAQPGGVLEHPNKLSKPAQDNLRASWNEMHQGLSNQHRIAILEEGLSYKQIGIPPENAQFLESRKYQLNEIERLLHIPPHMLADLERSTNNNIEHQGREFVDYTMMPWLIRWEQTCNRKLLSSFERNIFFCEFLVDALLRGDSAARSAFYRELFYLGALSPNDIREKENMNPIPDEGSDKYYIQQNMIPMEMAGKIAKPEPETKPTPEAVQKVAARDKANILRAFKKDPAAFETWAEDYFRDFPAFMEKELTNGK
jgi:HK97 family phage portal protein